LALGRGRGRRFFISSGVAPPKAEIT